MSKKLTSLMVLAAALLLAVPAQAQVFAKKKASTVKFEGAHKAVTSKELAKAGIAKKKADSQFEGKAFRGFSAAQEALTPVASVAKEDAGKHVQYWDWAKHSTPRFVSKSGLVNTDNMRQPLFKFRGREVERFARFDGQQQVNRRAATVDEHGIITAPDEGVTKYYTRTGTAFYVSSSSVYNEEQSGIVTIVECEDGGTVYIKDPISHYAQGTWVRGTKDGNTITVAAAQPLAWNANYSTTLALYWGNVQSTGTGNTYIKGEGDITFTVDDEAGTITLDGSSQDKIIAVYWDDDNSWTGYGDYGTVWTLNTDYQPASTDPIVLPDGAEVLDWYADGAGSAAVPANVKVAFVGDEVYISGLSTHFPEAWIKGTVAGTTVTFSKFQFVGMYSSTMPVWAVGADSQTGALQDFTMTYDAEAGKLTLDENQLLVFNAAEDRMYYLAYIETLTISANPAKPTVIDTLPYVNSFDTPVEQKQFTIIDANEDGRTWAFYNGMVRYTYHSTNTGDDWLISPQIYLQAGKKYKFSINAHSQTSSYPERFEVKAALAPQSLDEPVTAALMAAGSEVIAPTVVDNAGFQAYKNEAFTVAESGFYYIGIHGISDNDKYYFYIDDFSIEAAPIEAPYTADFSNVDTFNDFLCLDANEDGSTWDWTSLNGAYYSYSSDNQADDYLILPIMLKGGEKYFAHITAATQKNYAEKFEVVWGTEPTKEALTNTLIPEQEIMTDEQNVEFTSEQAMTVETDGLYYVAIHATSDADMYQLMVRNFSIMTGSAAAAATDLTAVQTPNALENVITFKAPAKNIAGDYLEALPKVEVLRDGVVVKTLTDVTPGTVQTVTDAVPVNGKYGYQVVTYADVEKAGTSTAVVYAIVKTPEDLPYIVDFADESALDLFDVIDNNQDGSTWKWYNVASYQYNWDNNADDYLVSLPLKLVKGKLYRVKLSVNSYNDSYPERFEVVIGKQPTAEALTQTVIEPTDVASGEPLDYEGLFTVEEDDNYYVAIHAISDANMWYLYVNSLTVENGPEWTAPAAADIEIIPGAEGDLSATVKVTAPTKDIEGNDLTENLKIEMYRDGVQVDNWTKTDVQPGAVVRGFDEPTAPGIYKYTVVVSNASGEGLKNEVSAFVGIDQPIAPEQAGVAETADGLHFEWSASPAIGQNGGFVNVNEVSYNIWDITLSSFFGMVFPEHNGKLATVKAQTAADVQYDTEAGEQQFKYFSIQPVNEFTADEEMQQETYTGLLVGKSYELPFKEGFTGNQLHYYWDTNAFLAISPNATDGDGTALAMMVEQAGQGYLMSGKINIKDIANPVLTFNVASPTVKNAVVGVSADGGELQLAAQLSVTGQNQFVKVPLAAYKNSKYIQFIIMADFPNAIVADEEGNIIGGDMLVIDDIRMTDLYQYNLGIALNAPAKVTAGQTATIKATVENKGENAANGYQVIIKAGRDVIFDKTVNESLPMYGVTEFQAEFPTTIFDNADDVQVSAEVVFATELEPEDNTAEAIFSIVDPAAAAPESLKATDNGTTGVDLEWTVAESSAQELTEGFDAQEIFEPFSIGGITAEQQTGTIGDWTVYDGNKMGVYGFNGISFPNAYVNQAWMVFNPEQAGAGDTYAARSGEQYLVSFCPVDENSNAPAGDHWLISPELTGDAQTISFYARVLTAQYGPETFEVLASSTDNKPESFTVVEGAQFSTEAEDWTEFSVSLPAGTKFFAIRHTSQDIFGLMIDDITYATAGASIAKFNIYFQGEKIADVEGDKTTYLVPAEKLTAGKRMTFDVTAVYSTGIESRPATAIIEVVTNIRDIVADGQPVDVYSLDGKLVRSQVKSFEGLKGVFVINGKAVLVK